MPCSQFSELSITAFATARLVMILTTSVMRGRDAPQNTIAAPARQPRERHAQEVLFAADNEPAFDKLLDADVGMASSHSPELRRDQADDPRFPLDYDGAPVVDVLGQHRILGSGHDEACLHDVLRLLHQIEIDLAAAGIVALSVRETSRQGSLRF